MDATARNVAKSTTATELLPVLATKAR
jgi:hypothetical protein